MIDAVLPPGLVGRVAVGVPADAFDTLAPAEADAVAGSVLSRREEFASGRWCARRALDALGVAPAASRELPVGADRAPVWPPGVVGSITHCRTIDDAVLAAAVVGRPGDWRAVGVDAEPAAGLPDDLLDHVALAVEVAWIERTQPDTAVPLDRLLFSAKEAAYKCYAAMGGPVLEFADVRTEVDLGSGTFTAWFVGDVPLVAGATVPGRFALLPAGAGDVLVTLATLAALDRGTDAVAAAPAMPA